MKLWAAFDPGLSTGLAVADEDGLLKGYTTIKFKDFEDTLLNWEKYWEYYPEAIIYEDYRLDITKEPRQSKIETVQVIGMLKMWAKTHGIPYVESARMNKAVGYKYWGKKPLAKSNLLNHAYDAAAHLYYYLVQNKITEVKL